MKNSKIKFGVKSIKVSDGYWSFGFGFAHAIDENYLYINFLRWCVFVGFLYKDRFNEE